MLLREVTRNYFTAQFSTKRTEKKALAVIRLVSGDRTLLFKLAMIKNSTEGRPSHTQTIHTAMTVAFNLMDTGTTTTHSTTMTYDKPRAD